MAQGILETLAKWALLLLFLAVILYALFNPKLGMLQKISKVALKFEGALPNEPAKEVKQNEDISKQATSLQQRFMEEIKRPTGSSCLLEYSPFIGLGDQKLEMLNYNNGVQSRILNPVGEEETGSVSFNPLFAENLQLCVIDPQPFADCIQNSGDCTKFVKNSGKVVLSEESIYLEDKEYSSYNLILKVDTKLCFIPFYRFGGWPGCDGTEEAIDDDCLDGDGIKAKIQICGAIRECQSPNFCTSISECSQAGEPSLGYYCESDQVCCMSR